MIDELKNGISALSAMLGVFRQIKDVLPDSPQQEALSAQLDAAERQLKLSEAQVAHALEYPLCRCTFPPQIMLFDKDKDADICPLCGHSEERQHSSVSVF